MNVCLYVAYNMRLVKINPSLKLQKSIKYLRVYSGKGFLDWLSNYH